MQKTKNFLKISFKVALYVFASIGLFFVGVFFAMQYGWLSVRGTIDERNKFFKEDSSPFVWENTSEWSVLEDGFLRDANLISSVSMETGVPARLIVAVIVPEQIRFFTSNRESYKKYFEPLKILGTMSQFSLGISGIKPETAGLVEKHLTDTNSEFYLGEKYANLLDYKAGEDHDTALYQRLTNQHNHYYDYLYAALFIKQVEEQWKSAGYDISHRPEIIATLFNLGFSKSKPNPSPMVGGAPITIAGTTVSFGELSREFYVSQKLRSVFPY